MGKVLYEILICIIAAVLLMVTHELVKSIVYLIVRCDSGSRKNTAKNILKIWRYIDPVGLILSVICYVPVSKPYMFRIRDKVTNRIIGIVGFIYLAVITCVSFMMMKYGNWGSVFWQYMTVLAADYFVVNLFPVSTFDIGLVIAGFSSKYYLKAIKSDTAIKLILMLTLFLDVIRYGSVRVISMLISL